MFVFASCVFGGSLWGTCSIWVPTAEAVVADSMMDCGINSFVNDGRRMIALVETLLSSMGTGFSSSGRPNLPYALSASKPSFWACLWAYMNLFRRRKFAIIRRSWMGLSWLTSKLQLFLLVSVPRTRTIRMRCSLKSSWAMGSKRRSAFRWRTLVPDFLIANVILANDQGIALPHLWPSPRPKISNPNRSSAIPPSPSLPRTYLTKARKTGGWFEDGPNSP